MDLKKFNEIESKYNLLEDELEGYCYWNYLRAQVNWAYLKKRMKFEEPSGAKGATQGKKRGKKVIDLIRHSGIGIKRCDLLVLNHPRRVLVDGYYECIYTDKIVERINNSVVLEEAYEGLHYQPTQTRRLIYTDMLDLYSYLCCSIHKLFFRRKYEEKLRLMLERIRQPLKELNEAYGVQVEAEEFRDSLIYGFYMYKAEKRYYKRILSRLKPKAILEVVSYNRKCMVVNEIASQMRIPTIELQHGTIGEEHIAYNFTKGSKIKQFPDYFLLFSDYWKTNVSFPIEEEKVIAAGYPYLERMAQKMAEKTNRTEKKNILFLSTEPIGKRLAQVAVELDELLKGKNYHIIFKLHPREYGIWKKAYPQLVGTEIEVVDHNRKNLYELYSISSIQVSGYGTTTIFEGLYFSLETYILNYGVEVVVDNLCKAGFALYFEEAKDLAAKILENKVSGKGIKNRLWKEGALKNCVDTINRIMEGNKIP